MNYNELSEVIVTNQSEMDAIPDDYRGQIYIDGIMRVAINKKYYLPVVARENSSVVARENSSVVARDNSSVEAWGNSQIVDRQTKGKIQISGNSRIVHMPQNIYEFMDFYGVKHTKTKAVFFKAVHKKSESEYCSNHFSDFKYSVGEKIEEKCDKDVHNVCSYGIHISYLAWALRFGETWKDLAILECETKISDIVLPENSNGKVRTSAVKVIREVPLEECGVYGRILARKEVNHVDDRE